MANIKETLRNKIGDDRLIHFGMGCVIAVVIAIPFMLRAAVETGADMVISTGLGVGFAAFGGLVSEAFDEKFDWADVLATVLGGCLVTLATLFGLLVR